MLKVAQFITILALNISDANQDDTPEWKCDDQWCYWRDFDDYWDKIKDFNSGEESIQKYQTALDLNRCITISIFTSPVTDILLSIILIIALINCYKKTGLLIKIRYLQLMILIYLISVSAHFYCLIRAKLDILLLLTIIQFIIISIFFNIFIGVSFQKGLDKFIKITQLNDEQLSKSINEKLKDIIKRKIKAIRYIIICKTLYILCIDTSFIVWYWALSNNTSYIYASFFWFLCCIIMTICDILIPFLLLINVGVMNALSVCNCLHSVFVADNVVNVNNTTQLNHDDNVYIPLPDDDDEDNYNNDDVVMTNITINSSNVFPSENEENEENNNLSAIGQISDKYCDIQKCYRVQIIVEAIAHHKASNFDIIQILNAFDHLLNHHDESQHFEIIYNKLQASNPCDIDNCLCFLRNHRRRMQSMNIFLNQQYEANHLQDIMDKIHLYYYHSYEMQMRRNDNNIDEKKDIEKEQKYDQNSFYHDEVFINNNKFCALTNDFINIGNQDQDNFKNTYSFGERFNYYDLSKNPEKDELNVYQKYSSIKDEALNNKICNINIDEFDIIYKKAVDFMDTQHVRIEMFNDVNNIPSVDQFVSLLLHCNCDQFQSKWNLTYRRIPSTESDNELIRRHAEFYYSSVNLRYLVENYGKQLFYSKDNTFYHGIDKQLYFTKTITQFKSPLSTSSEINVAYNFTNNNGIILELMYSSSIYPLKARYIDCAFFSDFVQEKECLFLGGIPIMIIENIINVANDEIYKQYIKALNVLNATMTASQIPSNEEAINLCYNMLLNQLNNDWDNNQYPYYAKTLFQKYCNNLSYALISKDILNNKQLSYLICIRSNAKKSNRKFKMLNLKQLLILFPNLIQIEWINQDGTDILMICDFLMIELSKKYLSKSENLKLKNIIIHHKNHVKRSIMNKYKGKIKRTEWNFYSNKNMLMFCYDKLNNKENKYKYYELFQANASKALLDNCTLFINPQLDLL